MLGTILGILWAKYKYKREIYEQKKLMRERLIHAFNFNLERIDQCLVFLSKEKPLIPNFLLDTSSILHLLSTGRDLFHKESYFDKFNWQRYQLEHINRKLVMFSNANIDKAPVPHLYSSLLEHLKTTKKEISELLEEYKEDD